MTAVVTIAVVVVGVSHGSKGRPVAADVGLGHARAETGSWNQSAAWKGEALATGGRDGSAWVGTHAINF